MADDTTESPLALHDQEPPFAALETSEIAVKVINHYGDEVMKIFSV